MHLSMNMDCYVMMIIIMIGLHNIYVYRTTHIPNNLIKRALQLFFTLVGLCICIRLHYYYYYREM